ncbi:DUF896 domain-containing protein [Fructilactobacillus vespulae]|uniref:DUF896 domain-containing protein n=1 Tax=Fructilactobacillus vespulae TaxID=1249630 RepID=UPI0039B414F5
MAEDPELKKILPRINELSRKAKVQELTEDEKSEREALRQKYLKRFRANFRSQVEMTQIFDKDGNEVTPEKVKEIQREKNLRDN